MHEIAVRGIFRSSQAQLACSSRSSAILFKLHPLTITMTGREVVVVTHCKMHISSPPANLGTENAPNTHRMKPPQYCRKKVLLCTRARACHAGDDRARASEHVLTRLFTRSDAIRCNPDPKFANRKQHLRYRLSVPTELLNGVQATHCSPEFLEFF